MLGFIAFLAYLLFWIPSGIQAIHDILRREPSGFTVWWKSLRWGVAGTFLLFVLNYAGDFYVRKYLWFGEVGYLPVIWTTYKTYWIVLAASTVYAYWIVWMGLRISRVLAPEVGSSESRPTGDRWHPEPKPFNPEELAAKERIWYFILSRIAAPIGALLAGNVAAADWKKILLYLFQEPTGATDPVFGKDLAFWLFTLPLLDGLWWWAGLTIGITIVVGVTYACAMAYLRTKGRGKEEQKATRIYFWRIGMGVACMVALWIATLSWLARYHLLYSTDSAAYGAGYTDLHVRLPMYGVFAVFLATTAAIFASACRCGKTKTWTGTAYIAAGFALLVWVVVVIYPVLFQRLTVRPDEFRKELPYIERTIAFTRAAYGLERIKDNEFRTKELSKRHTVDFAGALDNVRLWDWRTVKSTYNQQQALRRYYSFVDVDIDRYVIGKEYRQVMIAVRELVPEQVPERTWVNERLKYTHGYGAIAHFGSKKTSEGFPEFIMGDMPPYAPEGLQITRPQIYFGEATVNHVVVKSREPEFDYPLGAKNAETTYIGQGGVPINSGLRRLAIAWEFDGWVTLTSPLITPESRILFARRISDRIAKIAPFLTLDQDPYPVIRDDGTLVWIADTYTTTEYYPYSQPQMFRGSAVNYIRNSVKVVVDAYHGSVTFYMADPSDPIVKAWQRIFPKLFRPFGEMPPDLRRHIRYGEDLFSLQAAVLLDYHVTDPMVLYNKEDRWSVAEEQYEDNRQRVEPYYIVTRLSGEDRDEMMLVLPFTPFSTKETRKENLVGWLAARIDGDHYGELILYRFPKGEFRYGPMQVEAQIDQEKEMSAQITLWNQSGSKVVRGHLLVLPIGDAFLYTEPLYIKSTTSPMPQLQKVILATQRKVGEARDLKLHLVWGDTFEEAFKKLLKGGITTEKRAVETSRELVPGEILAQAKELLKRYREFSARGEFEKAGAELHALSELLK